MKNIKPTTFRAGKVLLGTALGFAIAMTLFTVAVWFYHPIVVWLHGGRWCTQFSPDGERQILYNEDCNH